jgi:hypothetical protein
MNFGSPDQHQLDGLVERNALWTASVDAGLSSRVQDGAGDCDHGGEEERGGLRLVMLPTFGSFCFLINTQRQSCAESVRYIRQSETERLRGRLRL